MTQAIVPKELLTATLGGLSLLVVSGGSSGDVLVRQSDGTYAPAANSTAVGSITGLGSGVSTFLATPSSANLRSALTDETGAGLAVFNDNPTFTRFSLGGNVSSPAWTTSGLRIRGVAATLTDTTSTGTVAAAYTNAYGGNTIAANSAVTFSSYFTSFFTRPIAGANVTITNRWAVGCESLRVVAQGDTSTFFQVVPGSTTLATFSGVNPTLEFLDLDGLIRNWSIRNQGGAFRLRDSISAVDQFVIDSQTGSITAVGTGAHVFGTTNTVTMQAGTLTATVAITAGGLMCAGSYTVGTLPSAAANTGKFANVTDSSVTTLGNTVAGGGANNVEVRSNGSNWRVSAI